MGEDGEQDAVYAGFVLESAHRPGPSADFAEASRDGVSGAHGAQLGFGFVAEAGEQLVKVVAQAGDGCRVLKALCKAPRCRAGGGSVGGKPDAGFRRQSFNPEGAGSIMASMLKEAGVVALYGTSFVDAVVKAGSGNDTITAIIVENTSGRQAITGRVFVEGSGTAQLAAAAGVPFVSGGGQPDGTAWDGVNRPIPGGLLWIMSDIDFAKVRDHQQSAKDPTLAKLMS